MNATHLLLCAALTLTPAAQVDGNTRWAGIENDTRAATRASVEFDVPTVNDKCGPGLTSNAAVWVGIGGMYGNAFAQLGVTLAPESRGAWYELFDHQLRGPEVDVPLDIAPGDRLRIRLAFTPDHSSLLFVWNDLSSGQRQERTIDRAARYWAGDSVEWIVERSRQTLADFGTLTFEDAYYTDTDGVHPLAPADYEAAIYTGPDWKRATRTTVDSPTSATVRWLRCA